MIRTKADWTQAEEDPFGALAILRAIQKVAEHVSDAFIGIIWVCLQPGVWPEFTVVTKLDASGRLPYAKPRGGTTLAECVASFLPPGFLDASDFAPGRSSFYSQGVVQSSTASKATVARMKDTGKENANTDDDTFYSNAISNAELLLEQRRTFITTPYAGETDRDARTRLTEKLGSGQLFGRQARAAAGVFIDGWLEDALADPDTDGDDALRAKLVMAAATEFTVVNKVFVTKRFITAVARIGGVAYGLGRKMSDIEEDVEALVAATTGSMIETGGTNVAHLGCLPKVHSR